MANLSFANPDPGVVQAPLQAASTIKTDYSAPGMQPLPPTQDKSNAAILNFVSGVTKNALAPLTKDMLEKQTLEGMTRAASGEALSEIINEQPWYTRIWGPSASVEGARAYTVQARMDAAAHDIEMRMPELRKKSPQEVQAEILKASQDMKTGDEVTDTQAQLSMLRLAPGILKQYTKENYKYVQEQMAVSQFTAWGVSGSRYNSMITTNGVTLDPELRQDAEGSLLSGLRNPVGGDETSYTKRIAAFVGKSAEAGEFHTVNLLVNHGVVDNLPPEMRLTVERAINAFGKQAAAASAADYSERLIKLDLGIREGRVSALGATEELDAINKDYRDRTGNQQPMISPATYVQAGHTASQTLLARQKADAIEAKKSKDLNDMRRVVLLYGTQAARDTGEFKRAEIDNAFMGFLKSLPTDEARWVAIGRDAKSIPLGQQGVSTIETQIAQMFADSGDTMSPTFLNLYKMYSIWRDQGHKGAIASYLKPDQQKLLDNFHRELNGGNPAEMGALAYERAKMGVVKTSFEKLTKDEREMLESGDYWQEQPGGESAFDYRFDWMKGKFGHDLFPHSRQMHIEAMSKVIPQIRYGYDSTLEVMEAARQRMGGEGVEPVGRWSFRIPEGGKTIGQAFASMNSKWGDFTPQETAEGLDELIWDRLKAQTKETPRNIITTRLPDQGGLPMVAVYFEVGNQTLVAPLIAGQELVTKMRGMQAQRAEEARTGTVAKLRQGAKSIIRTQPGVDQSSGRPNETTAWSPGAATGAGSLGMTLGTAIGAFGGPAGAVAGGAAGFGVGYGLGSLFLTDPPVPTVEELESKDDARPRYPLKSHKEVMDFGRFKKDKK